MHTAWLKMLAMYRDPSDLETLDDFLDEDGIREEATKRASRDVALASEPPKKERKKQIRPALRDALALIVTEGRSITDAAEACGMARETLSKALKRPHVIEAKAAIAHAWRQSRTEKALVTIADLSVNAASEDVKLKAARSWLEIVGELGPNRRDDTPRAQQLVQIINHGGGRPPDVTITTPNASGVFEAAPWAPVNRPGKVSPDE